jgi:hypothetical protein
VVEGLHSTCTGLSSVPSIREKGRKEGREGGRKKREKRERKKKEKERERERSCMIQQSQFGVFIQRTEIRILK